MVLRTAYEFFIKEYVGYYVDKKENLILFNIYNRRNKGGPTLYSYLYLENNIYFLKPRSYEMINDLDYYYDYRSIVLHRIKHGNKKLNNILRNAIYNHTIFP